MSEQLSKQTCEQNMVVPLPFIVEKDEETHTLSAWCPILDIATDGDNDEELRKNIDDLVQLYFENPDTIKPKLQSMIKTSITIMNVPVNLKSKVLAS